jgi:hypothetical protein
MSKFVELVKVPIQEKRNLVISKSENGIVLGQQVIYEEGKKKIPIFLKGAIFVDLEYIPDMREAIEQVIEKIIK